MNSNHAGSRLGFIGGTACIILGLVMLSGCDEGMSPRERKAAQQAAAQKEAAQKETSQKDAKQSATPSATPSQSTPAATPSASPNPTPTPTPTSTPSATPANPPATVPQTPATTEKKAAVGVGKKGHYGPGIVATPAASIWAVEERLAFEALIPQAMNLFKATEGRAPKDHAEYMEKIIKANNIKLPQLPQGDRYRYDPKTEQLMVESPSPE